MAQSASWIGSDFLRGQIAQARQFTAVKNSKRGLRDSSLQGISGVSRRVPCMCPCP